MELGAKEPIKIKTIMFKIIKQMSHYLENYIDCDKN